MTTLTLRQLNRATLARQLLLERAQLPPVKAIEQLAGLQAQLARPPYVALWSRLEDFGRESLTTAIAKKQVVRATLMRGTLHLVSKADYLAFRPALQPVLARGAERPLKERSEALDVEQLSKEARAFFDEQPRTFDALRKHLARAHPGADERAMAYLIRMHLPLVQVPEEGAPWGWKASADFAVAETWLGKKIATDGSKADVLAMHYFAAFGPATVADFQTWSGLVGARDLIESLRPKLVTFRDEKKRELFDLPDAPRPDADVEAPVRFLPDFDNLLLGHADRTRVIADEHRPRIATKNLRIPPVFLVDGFVAGTWDVKPKKNLTIEPFVKLTKKTLDEVVAEGERVARFIEES